MKRDWVGDLIAGSIGVALVAVGSLSIVYGLPPLLEAARRARIEQSVTIPVSDAALLRQPALDSLVGLSLYGPFRVQIDNTSGVRVDEIAGIRIATDVSQDFWQIKMPCGFEASYPLNGLPETSVPCPCGDPTHWLVKYEVVQP